MPYAVNGGKYTVKVDKLPKVTMMAAPVEEVNVTRALWFTNAFHFLFSSAKACLFPFLTVYLRYLGLTPLQTGIVVGTKTAVITLCSFLWMACAAKYQKYRAVMMLSIYTLIATYLALTFVPPTQEYAAYRFCSDSEHARIQGNFSKATTPFPKMNTTHIPDQFSPKVTPAGKETTFAFPTKATARQSSSTRPPTSKPLPSTVPTTVITTKLTSVETTKAQKMTTVKPRSTTKAHPTTKLPTTHLVTQKPTHPSTTHVIIHKVTKNSKHQHKTPSHSQSAVELLGSLSDEDIDALERLGIQPGDLQDMSIEDLRKFLEEKLQDMKHGGGSHRTKRGAQEFWESFKNLLKRVKKKLTTSDNKTFIIVMVIIGISSIFAVPVEKMADKGLFEFLDSVDMIEKYGQHALWGAIGFVFAPIVVTTIVDHVNCVLPIHVYKFAIHVYLFAALAGFVFLLTLFYPLNRVQRKSRKKPSSMGRGLKTICHDAHTFAFSATIFMVGLTQAGVSNFMFWKVQDIGGQEMPMGLAVTVAALVEVVVFFTYRLVVRKLGHGGAAIFAMLLMSGRTLFYSFLMNPWLIVAGEAFYGFSNALLWHTVHSYPDFRLSALVTDRSATDMLNTVHQAFGFSIGSVLSGLLYNIFGLDILFQGCAGLLFLWTLIYGLIMKCCRKRQKIRYTMLLQGDQIGTDDSSDDDWLEVALNESK